MTRTTFIAAIVAAVFSTFNFSSASAQEDCVFFYERTGEDGSIVRVCAENVRETAAAATAVGSLDRARAASTRTSPVAASTSISPAVDAYPFYGFGGSGYGGFYPPPDDPRQAWAIRDALLGGIQVTAFEERVREASNRGIRDGEHQAVMARLDEIETGYREEISRLRAHLEAAVALGNRELEAVFAGRIAEKERELAVVSTGGGSASFSAGKAEKEPEDTPEAGTTVQEHFGRRLPQFRER